MSLSGSFVSSFPIIGDISEVVIAPIVKMNEKDESENPKSLVTGSKNNVNSGRLADSNRADFFHSDTPFRIIGLRAVSDSPHVHATFVQISSIYHICSLKAR